MLRRFRYILFPFSVVYGSVIGLRNKLFDKNILRSASFNFPIVCIGNLALGGTGKTPMTEYLIRLLDQQYEVATLSRGYKRKTKGFAIADEKTTAIDIGDEPMQLHKKFPNVSVAVAEERVVGIPQLLHSRPQTQVILLDDAFQHREVRAGLNILLTEYSHLYTRDLILPAGNLRDVKQSSARAHIIVVTKCKTDLEEAEKNALIKELDPLPHQKIYFTSIDYGMPHHLFTKETISLNQDVAVLLISGVANPKPLEEVVGSYVADYDLMLYRDHHIFSIDDFAAIKRRFGELGSPQKIILTTEKDGVRLAKFESELQHLPVYVLPMKHRFLFDEAAAFNSQVVGFVKDFYPG
jgi:tetraacyldisaccharide 4'-kinase